MPTTTRRYCSIAAAASALVVSTVFGLGVGLAPPAGADTVVDGCTVVASPTPSDHTQCPGSDFAGADLADLDLSYADLGDSSFVQCVGNPETGVYTCQTADLSDSDLTDADLAGSATDFCEAVPEPSKVCATVGLDGADLEGADLAGDNLAGAGLVDADLEGADLAGVSFLVCGDGCFSADLAGADLTGTSLVPGDQAGIASGPSGAKASWRTPRALPGRDPGGLHAEIGLPLPGRRDHGHLHGDRLRRGHGRRDVHHDHPERRVHPALGVHDVASRGHGGHAVRGHARRHRREPALFLEGGGRQPQAASRPRARQDDRSRQRDADRPQHLRYGHLRGAGHPVRHLTPHPGGCRGLAVPHGLPRVEPAAPRLLSCCVCSDSPRADRIRAACSGATVPRRGAGAPPAAPPDPVTAASTRRTPGTQTTRNPVANIRSQIKRNRQTVKRQARNKSVRSELRTRTKKAIADIEQGAEDSEETLRLAVKRIDKAAAKGVIHKNQAANRKARLMRRAARASADA